MIRTATKLAAALSAAILLASGADMAFAATAGWQLENGDWTYLDSEGGYVTDAWKRAGGRYFYLDEDGKMSVNTLIEYDGETYYVGPDGARALNTWVSVPNNGLLEDGEINTLWFRFGSGGKAYRDGKKTIDGKTYIFHEEGFMLSGWQTYGDEGDLYYLGTENEGWAYTGWQYLEPDEDGPGAYDGQKWFYFNPRNGKAYRDARKYINGRYYTFDENGVMSDKWVSGTPGAPDYSGSGAASDSHALYREESGDQQTGWVYVYAPDDENEDGDQGWYYLDSKGVPFNEQAKDSYLKATQGWNMTQKINGRVPDEEETGAAARVIGKKTYLFDSSGKMMTGFYYLQGIRRKGSSSDLGFTLVDPGHYTGSFYYFNHNEGPDEGQMMTGKQTIRQDGETYHCYLRNDGRAYINTIADGSLYDQYGLRVDAEDGNTYEPCSVEDPFLIFEKGASNTYSNCTFIVNSSGKLKKSGVVKIDGVKYTVKNYIVIKEEPAD